MKKVAETSKHATKKDVSKIVDKAVDNLAMLFAKSFGTFGEKIEERFDKVENRLDNVGKKLDTLENTVKATRNQILLNGDKFVGRKEFDTHVSNFNKFEKQVKEKVRI